MKASERVAVLTALQKQVKAALAEAREEADGEMLGLFESEGFVKRDLRLNGVKVGEQIVVMRSSEWEVEDASAFHDFALTYGLAHLKATIRPEWMARAADLVREESADAVVEEVVMEPKWERMVVNVAGTPQLADSGMVIPGLAFVGKQPKTVQVRGCKPADVAPLLGGPEGVAKALAPGDE